MSDLQSNQYSLSCYRKPANFAYGLPLFHSHSTNISLIASLNAGGERARKTGQSAYSTCYDTIRTQILHCSQSCRNCKVGTAVQFQPGQKHTVLCPVRATKLRGHTGSGFWTGLEPNWTVYPAQTRIAGGLLRPVANTTHGSFCGSYENVSFLSKSVGRELPQRNS